MDIQLEGVFREPQGWRNASVFLVGAVAIIGMYLYAEVIHDSGLVSMLVMGVAMAITGIADILPTDNQRIAGALRIGAIAILSVLVLVLGYSLVTAVLS